MSQGELSYQQYQDWLKAETIAYCQRVKQELAKEIIPLKELLAKTKSQKKRAKLIELLANIHAVLAMEITDSMVSWTGSDEFQVFNELAQNKCISLLALLGSDIGARIGGFHQDKSKPVAVRA